MSSKLRVHEMRGRSLLRLAVGVCAVFKAFFLYSGPNRMNDDGERALASRRLHCCLWLFRLATVLYYAGEQQEAHLYLYNVYI